MATTKCAHPACHCQITDNAYCNDTCREAAKVPIGESKTCPCEHPGVSGGTLRRSWTGVSLRSRRSYGRRFRLSRLPADVGELGRPAWV
jgi:hypothetical protein